MMDHGWRSWRILLLLPVLATLAAAFGTINEPFLMGQNNEHEMITRLAFQCPSGEKSDGFCFEPRSLDQLAGYHWTVMGLALPGVGFNGAVGAPDNLDPLPEGPEAHCDDADFLDLSEYPQSRAEATAKLQACVDHLRGRFRQGLTAAERLLDERRRIRKDMVQLERPYDCRFAFSALQGEAFVRAKCSAIEGFGRALHGIQDFYAHSNWADTADSTAPISVSNPPGLGRDDTAPFLDLRANGTISSDQIPHALTTGCFTLPDSWQGSGDCQGRITHHALSKDNGIIRLDGTFGEGYCSPRSEASPDNFRRAVLAAVQHSRDAWDGFREELRRMYGSVRGNLMICALVRDNPVTDCRTRTVAVAVDNSAGSVLGRQVQLQLLDGVTSRLAMHGLDRMAVLQFNGARRLLYPMGYPMDASYELSVPSGPRRLAGGLELGIAETIHAQPETYADRGAVVLLTTGADDAEYTDDTLTQLRRASEESIRVHYACIRTPVPGSDATAAAAGGDECTLTSILVPAVLNTGGLVAVIHSLTPKTRSAFASMLMDRGLTGTDDDDTPDHTRLYPGITVANALNPSTRTKSFFYPVSAGENLNFTLTNLAIGGHRSGACFTVLLWNKALDAKIATHTRCGSEEDAQLSLVYEATAALELVLAVEYGDALAEHEVLTRDELMFAIALDSSMPEKEETSVRRRTSIVSLSMTRTAELPIGLVTAATEEAVTSETLEILESTRTVGGETSTSARVVKATGHVAEFESRHFEGLATGGVPTAEAMMMGWNASSSEATLDVEGRSTVLAGA